MTDYNYDSFSAGHYTLDNFQGPATGRKAQDFPMQTTDGGQRQLLDFNGDFLVLNSDPSPARYTKAAAAR